MAVRKVSHMKTYLLNEGTPPASQIGAALEALASTIHERQTADNTSYTHRLLTGKLDDLLKKIVEEAHETTLAAKDANSPQAHESDIDHLRYEAGDVVYHLLVLLERCGISLDEFAAELNSRMSAEQLANRPGAVLLKPEHINRGHAANHAK